jgi:hypothetical protein
MIAKRLYLLPFILALAVLGCSLPGGETEAPLASTTEAPVPTADYSLELPFEGIWTNDEGTVLVLTVNRFYFKFLQGEEGEVVTENFAEILDYDLDAGHLHIYMDSVLLNTRPGGFDYPQRYLVFDFEGDTLRIAFSDETYSDRYEEYELTRY